MTPEAVAAFYRYKAICDDATPVIENPASSPEALASVIDSVHRAYLAWVEIRDR